MARGLGLVTLGLLIVVLGRGLWLATRRPPTSDAYLWGAFHAHSTLSDGLGTWEEMAREARQARVAFILMSDHGAPHPSAAWSETIDGVRFVGGSEVGLPEGRLIVSDADTLPDYALPSFPPAAAADVRRWGGFAVLAYPEDPLYRWSYWEDDFQPDGMEVINVTSALRAAPWWRVLDWGVFSLFNRHYYVSGLPSPAYALDRWDELLERGPVVGLYASNVHGGLRLADRWDVPVPSYRTGLEYVGLGIEPRHGADPAGAIRAGQFFSLVRGAGEPERFTFARDARGRLAVRLETAPSLQPRIVLKEHGQVVAETRTGMLTHPARRGVYRVEVYLEDHALLAPDVPWILSNPIRIDLASASRARAVAPCETRQPFGLQAIRLEMDPVSTGVLAREGDGLTLDYHLARSLPDDPQRWVALALRVPRDLTGSTGLYLDAEADRPMRYLVDVRTAGAIYHASALVDARRRAVVPWREFYPFGEVTSPIPLNAIESVFIQVTDATTRTDFDARLRLFGLGACH